jgi:hypothetical protein
MKKWYAGLIGLLLVSAAVAAGSEPTDSSVRELMVTMRSKKILEGTMEQVDAMIQASTKQALAVQAASAAQQKAIDDMRMKMMGIFKQEMAWDVMEPIFVDVYKKSFTQEELDGMLAFYKSPLGQALIEKMPLVMQNTLQAMKSRMAVMMPKIQELQRDTIAQLKNGEQK